MKNNYSDYYYQTNKEYVDVEYKEVEPKKAVAAKNGLSKPITWLLVLGLSVGVAFGSGSAVTRLASNASIKKIIVLSRDETENKSFAVNMPAFPSSNITFFLIG